MVPPAKAKAPIGVGVSKASEAAAQCSGCLVMLSAMRAE